MTLVITSKLKNIRFFILHMYIPCVKIYLSFQEIAAVAQWVIALALQAEGSNPIRHRPKS